MCARAWLRGCVVAYVVRVRARVRVGVCVHVRACVRLRAVHRQIVEVRLPPNAFVMTEPGTMVHMSPSMNPEILLNGCGDACKRCVCLYVYIPVWLYACMCLWLYAIYARIALCLCVCSVAVRHICSYSSIIYINIMCNIIMCLYISLFIFHISLSYFTKRVFFYFFVRTKIN